MAVCETEHWILDCGAGHSCYLSEMSGSGELGAWGCGGAGTSSADMKAPRRKAESRPLDLSTQLEFCCTDMPRGELLGVFDGLVDAQLVVPKGTYNEQVTHCATGTLDEHLRAIGLVVGD